MSVIAFHARRCEKTVVSLDGRILRSGLLLDRLGYGSKLTSMHFLDVTHPEDLAVSAAANRWLRSGHGRLILDKRYVARDGGIVTARVHLELVRDTRGRPAYLRAWPCESGLVWGASSRLTETGTASDIMVLREGFVVERASRAAQEPPPPEARRLVLPDELL